MDSLGFKPIGFIESELKNKYDSPRQGVLVPDSDQCKLILADSYSFDQALLGLEDFERLWLIYQFHKNENWKPQVLLPRNIEEKKGVFATRSPYRPNPIGICAAELVHIEGRVLTLKSSDLLDGTPVLDIKPYLDYSDSFQTKMPEWLESADEEAFDVQVMGYAKKQMEYLDKKHSVRMQQFVDHQLKFDPINDKKKRVKVLESFGEGDAIYEISYRTWRIQFSLDSNRNIVHITKIYSGYSKEELLDQDKDPYGDKQTHRSFIKKY
ncbi:MAG: tRNA (N6-threonylcarbamoyladenosine(37)-N6)-methyltransferase TrmO [Bdellovibrionales bacterium]